MNDAELAADAATHAALRAVIGAKAGDRLAT